MEYRLSRDISKNELYNVGFRYNGNNYIAMFPIYYYINKNNKTPIVFVKINIHLDENTYYYSVVNKDKTIYATYYNSEYGNSEKYIKQLNKNMNAVFNKLCNKNIFEKKQKRINHKRSKNNE